MRKHSAIRRPVQRLSVTALIAPLLASVFVPVASAQDNGIYLGAAFADVTTDYDWRQSLLGGASDDDTSGYKLIGGFRPTDHFAIEANYADLGTAKAPLSIACIALVGFPCPNEAVIETQAVSVSALGFVTLPLLDLYGRVGVSRWEADGDIRFTTGGPVQLARTTRTGTDPTVGLGVQLRFAGISLRAEYEHFEILDDSAAAISIGFTYTFL